MAAVDASATGPSRASLAADRRQLEARLERIARDLRSDSRASVRSLWAELDASLLAHLDAEEHFLFESLGDLFRREVSTLLAEHRYIRARLAELSLEVSLDTARGASLISLIEDLRAHARHEEAVLDRYLAVTGEGED